MRNPTDLLSSAEGILTQLQADPSSEGNSAFATWLSDFQNNEKVKAALDSNQSSSGQSDSKVAQRYNIIVHVLLPIASHILSLELSEGKNPNDMLSKKFCEILTLMMHNFDDKLIKHWASEADESENKITLLSELTQLLRYYPQLAKIVDKFAKKHKKLGSAISENQQKKILETSLEQRDKISTLYYYKKNYLNLMLFNEFFKGITGLKELRGQYPHPTIKEIRSENIGDCDQNCYFYSISSSTPILVYADKHANTDVLTVELGDIDSLTDQKGETDHQKQQILHVIGQHFRKNYLAKSPFKQPSSFSEALFGSMPPGEDVDVKKIGLIQQLYDLNADHTRSSLEKLHDSLDIAMEIYALSCKELKKPSSKQLPAETRKAIIKIRNHYNAMVVSLYYFDSEYLSEKLNEKRAEIFLNNGLGVTVQKRWRKYRNRLHLSHRNKQADQMTRSIKKLVTATKRTNKHKITEIYKNHLRLKHQIRQEKATKSWYSPTYPGKAIERLISSNLDLFKKSAPKSPLIQQAMWQANRKFKTELAFEQATIDHFFTNFQQPNSTQRDISSVSELRDKIDKYLGSPKDSSKKLSDEIAQAISQIKVQASYGQEDGVDTLNQQYELLQKVLLPIYGLLIQAPSLTSDEGILLLNIQDLIVSLLTPTKIVNSESQEKDLFQYWLNQGDDTPTKMGLLRIEWVIKFKFSA